MMYFGRCCVDIRNMSTDNVLLKTNGANPRDWSRGLHTIRNMCGRMGKTPRIKPQVRT
jgi:hypothetical protein